MGRWDQGLWDTAKWDAEAADLFLPRITDKPPAPRDYSVALQATTRPAFVPLVVGQKSIPKAPSDVYFPPSYKAALAATTTFVQAREVVVVIGSYGDEGPSPRRKAGYWPALQASSYPVRVTYLPTVTPSDTYFQAITPDPVRPDYSRAIGSTTQPVGQLVGVLAGGPLVGSTLAAQPDQPPPRGADYRVALGDTTYPIWDAQPPTFTALTTSLWFASPLDPLPRRPDYWTALASTSSFTLAYKQPPPSPVPTVCTVTFQDNLSSSTVTLQPGTSTTVTLSGAPAAAVTTLVPGTGASVSLVPTAPAPVVPFVANPSCP